MEKSTITHRSIFERIRKVDENGAEYWSARDLGRVLEYADYRNFLRVVEKAKEACKSSSHDVLRHFVEFNDMAQIGLGVEREVESIKLSRYACYREY